MVEFTGEKGRVVIGMGLQRKKEKLLSVMGGRVSKRAIFSWIERGRGYFDQHHQRRNQVPAGSLIIQSANSWHCFDPDPGSHWDELWIMADAELLAGRFGLLMPPEHEVWKPKRRSMVAAWMEEMWAMWPPREEMAGDCVDYCLHRLLAERARDKGCFVQSHRDPLIRGSLDIFERELHAEDLDMRLVAAELGCPYDRFRMLFRDRMGIPPKQWYLQRKISLSKDMLEASQCSVKAVATEMGFKDAGYFSRLFRKQFGLSPQACQQG